MGEIVKTILALALVAWQTAYYEAKVTTFGCTSIDAVSQLQKVRPDGKAFQAALMEKQIYGECVAILKGTLVQGSIEAADYSILRVNQEIDPPGYEAPLGDFETKAMDEKRGR
jgi:hypothetical protein